MAFARDAHQEWFPVGTEKEDGWVNPWLVFS